MKPGCIRVVSALGSFGGVVLGKIYWWVDSALVDASFLPIFRLGRFGPESFRPNSLLHIYINLLVLILQKINDGKPGIDVVKYPDSWGTKH